VNSASQVKDGLKERETQNEECLGSLTSRLLYEPGKGWMEGGQASSNLESQTGP
jgi:hypothetical protein